MGFEVKYIYHVKKDDGFYDLESKEEKLKKIGKPFDDTPLETCASFITNQLARRDILVIDVEVNELVKKSLTYKLSPDGKGIVLKNKKFLFNSSLNDVVVDECDESQEDVPNNIVDNTTQIIDNPYQDIPPIQANSKSLRNFKQDVVYCRMIYEPQLKIPGLPLTKSKIYPVHGYIESPLGLEHRKIVITNDQNSLMSVKELDFVLKTPGVGAQFEKGREEQDNYKLSYTDDGQSSYEMPQLR